jgi:hypothetical protein
MLCILVWLHGCCYAHAVHMQLMRVARCISLSAVHAAYSSSYHKLQHLSWGIVPMKLLDVKYGPPSLQVGTSTFGAVSSGQVLHAASCVAWQALMSSNQLHCCALLVSLTFVWATIYAHSCMLHAWQDAVDHAPAAVASKSNNHNCPGS